MERPFDCGRSNMPRDEDVLQAPMPGIWFARMPLWSIRTSGAAGM